MVMNGENDAKTMRVYETTLERLRKHKPYPEMSDDKLLNMILDKLEAAEPKKEGEDDLGNVQAAD